MSLVPASLRTQTVKPWIPILAMTATLTVNEIVEVEKMLCINKNKCVKITSSPIQPQYMLFNILRPNTFYGNNEKGEVGTKHLLDRLVLKEFDICVK